MKHYNAPLVQNEADKKTHIWNKILNEMCNCYEDDVGNRPCDNGTYCDRCMCKDVQEVYKRELEAAGLNK